jgi:hypothetical protein
MAKKQSRDEEGKTAIKWSSYLTSRNSAAAFELLPYPSTPKRTGTSGTSLNVPYLFQEHDFPNFLKRPQRDMCQHIRVVHRQDGLHDVGENSSMR